MKIDNKFLITLIRYRVSIIILLFLALMAVAFGITLSLGFITGKPGYSQTIINYIPIIMFFSALLLLIFYIATGIIKSRLEKGPVELIKDETELLKSWDEALSFGYKNIRVFFACFGSFTASFILLIVFTLFLGFEDQIEMIFTLYFYIGCPIWFLSTWRFFAKKLS